MCFWEMGQISRGDSHFGSDVTSARYHTLLRSGHILGFAGFSGQGTQMLQSDFTETLWTGISRVELNHSFGDKGERVGWGRSNCVLTVSHNIWQAASSQLYAIKRVITASLVPTEPFSHYICKDLPALHVDLNALSVCLLACFYQSCTSADFCSCVWFNSVVGTVRRQIHCQKIHWIWICLKKYKFKIAKLQIGSLYSQGVWSRGHSQGSTGGGSCTRLTTWWTWVSHL